jgi:hypothetical protein
MRILVSIAPLSQLTTGNGLEFANGIFRIQRDTLRKDVKINFMVFAERFSAT